MTRHALAVRILGAALLLGVVWDAMMRWVPFGVNVLIWTTLFVILGIRCRVSGIQAVAADETGAASPDPADTRHLTPDTIFIAAAALLAALGILFRDCEPLIVLDILLLMLFLPLLGLGARGVRLHAAGLGKIALGWVLTGIQAVAGFFMLFARDLDWSVLPRAGSGRMRVVVRGTLIALPALLVFGALLTSADAQFESLVHSLFVFELDELFLHVLVTAVMGAICAGFLRSFAHSDTLPELGGRPFTLAAAETSFALGLVNVLFALFVGVQFRYFFGAAPDALSAYARRGFFELVWVVALVVPMLLLLDWLVDRATGSGVFRAMALLQIILVLIIAASAYYRMHLYRAEFGLTQARLFTTAFMIWLALVLVWLALTVLTERHERFAIGALATGVAAVVVLHVINPDALIVRTNLDRIGQRAFDSRYAAELSDDAAEVIFTDPRVPPMTVWEFARRRRTIGWRTWNVSRARAVELARAYESKATPPMRPGRLPGSTRESSSSRRLEISRNR
jgi:Domain of unknown function (DUF4173)